MPFSPNGFGGLHISRKKGGAVMAYNAALNTVYNHYLTTYAPKGTTQYDTHKKSELRGIYNSIVKLNKEAPLYILDTTTETQEFAVGIKENARELRNTIASLGGLSEDEILNKKTAYSSNEGLVSATFVGSLSEKSSIEPFNIEVTALASNQVNTGTFLPSSKAASLASDSYSFDILINDLNYEFQYHVREGETNKDLQERLARLISNADIGLAADVVGDGKGNSALRLSSASSGLKFGKNFIFHISDDKTSKRAGSVEYLGLNSVSRPPSNARFILNGEERFASSNNFTVDKMFELRLNGISSGEDDTAEIGLKADVDSLAENINNLIMGYNSFINTAAAYLDSHPKSGQLLKEMQHISNYYRADLNEIGLSFDEDGRLGLDQTAFKQAALAEPADETLLSSIKDFTGSILRKTNQVSLNPMHYVDKTIVAYKNPGRCFASPYVTSAYSGMMFNSYC